MDVSIIIVNWNTRDILRDCLKSVYEQVGQVVIEVIVIDNASSDGSPEMVRAEFPQVILMANSQNQGFARANNQAIVVAKGRYILLLNSDTVVLADAIAKVVEFADANPDTAVIGCRVLNPDGTLQPTCFRFPSLLNLLLSSTYLYKLFPRNRFFGRERMLRWDRNDVREVDVVTGCFMLVRRGAIQQVGALDETFFMYGEETDWCYRFKRAGCKIMFTPDAQIIHFGGQSSKQAAPQMTLQLRGSILHFLRKHRSRLEYWLACLLVFLFFAVRVPAWLCKSLVSRENRSYCWQRAKIYLVGIWKLLKGGGQALCIQP